MIARIASACLLLAALAGPASAQTKVESTAPTLAELLQNVYGPHGLIVDSEAVLPDGSTHSAHFNGAFQSEFGRINIALVRQLGALPIPSPASGFTYAFDNATGTFIRSTQSFGPILADRAETIGRGRFAFGYGVQQFSFDTFDGLNLSHIPAVFTHDDSNLGGGRSDIITTNNAISASVSQSTFSLTYGATERLDISFGVPVVRTSLNVVSDATVRRIGTASNPAIHFFRDPEANGTYGSERTFVAKGSAAGLGDVIVRAKGTAFKTARAGLALGLEARLPTGQAENLLGSGSFGLKGFEAVSVTYGRVAPHVDIAYQWNGPTILAGDVATNVKGNLPDELSFVAGADVGIEKRLSLAFDVLGRHSTDALRLSSSTYTPVGSQPFQDITFGVGALNVMSGSVGLKANVAGTMLVTFNLQFKLNDGGVRARVIPLVGIEYGF
ncbi:MAG: hypothetical protein JWL71_297 [Acidobacteria bacterium]|nr:hypothetical protein [Acidobacteriota bacterium]